MQRTLVRYLIFEYLPGLLIGLLSFLFILLMFQIFRLTEFFLIHGVEFHKVIDLCFNLGNSLVPAILPVSALFAMVLTFSRLSHDGESVAFVSLGISPINLLLPFLIFGFILSLLTAYHYLEIAPRSNFKFESAISELSRAKSQVHLKENTFTDIYDNLKIFVMKSNSRTGELEKVLIFDESNSDHPIAIIAKSGLFITEVTPTSSSAWIKLFNGSIHTQSQTYAKINFKEYLVKVSDQDLIFAKNEKSLNSWTLKDLINGLQSQDLRKSARIEVNKRLSVAFANLLLIIFGFAVSFNVNRRQQTNSFAVSVMVIASYWFLVVLGETVAKNEILPPEISLWIANAIFLSLSIRKLKAII
ncbi:MAG: LptF/LptG family permease [Bdellovibrionaceae bacterium]|nr:LptF/LptG family permease [Pseudobdellovibrionaceae bacterium]MDW8189405.1 LptF/LptG family permease [Pseudobdellovibrionaceae bacterium]